MIDALSINRLVTPERKYREGVISLVRSRLDHYAEDLCERQPLILRSILFQGKLTRSRVFFSIEKHLKAEDSPAISTAAAIELLHEASLIHDDVQDQQMTRRGRQSVYGLLGAGQAVNLGDQMVSLAYDSILKSNLRDDEKLRVISLINSTFHKMCQGQAIEMGPLEKSFNVETYWEAVHLKTCSLLDCIGKLVLPENETLSTVLRTAGQLYQLDNDLKDFCKCSESLDFKNKVQTLPIILLYEKRNKPNSSLFWRDFPKESEISSIKLMTMTQLSSLHQKLIELLNENFPERFTDEFLMNFSFATPKEPEARRLN